MELQGFCFDFYVVTSRRVLYPKGAFASPFLFLGVLLGLSSWVELGCNTPNFVLYGLFIICTFVRVPFRIYPFTTLNPIRILSPSTPPSLLIFLSPQILSSPVFFSSFSSSPFLFTVGWEGTWGREKIARGAAGGCLGEILVRLWVVVALPRLWLRRHWAARPAPPPPRGGSRRALEVVFLRWVGFSLLDILGMTHGWGCRSIL